MIINERPPNFEQILEAGFHRAVNPGVLFAYGDHIYNPSGIVVPPALIAHEEVHLNRQRDGGPIRWWGRYMHESNFRYREELLAHAAEFKAQRSSDRNFVARLMVHTALRLVAPLYNYVPPVSLQQAIRDLKAELAR